MNPQHLDPLLLQPPLTSRATPWLVVATLVAACSLAGFGQPAVWLMLIAPLLEEIVFRAGLHSILLRRVTADNAVGLIGANALTALAFGAAHVVARPSWLAAATVLPALLIGWTYQRHRSVLACAGLHALFNAIWLTSAALAA